MPKLSYCFVIGLFLSGCSAPFYQPPTLATNYQLELVHGLAHNHAGLWLAKMDTALAVEELERPLLEESSEPHVEKWRNSIEKYTTATELIQAEGVNSAVNREVTYLNDYEHWQRLGRWGYPYEALVEGGDCEDIALLKMESLMHLGWLEDQFAILIGTTNLSTPPESHAVLLSTLKDGRQIILDSLEERVVAPRRDFHFNPIQAVTRTHVYQIKTNE